MRQHPVAVFFIQLILGTAGSLFLGSVLGFVLALPFGYFSSGEGNIVDRTDDTWFVQYLTDNPYFAVQIVTAICLGFLSYRFFRSQATVWVWVVPATILVLSVVSSLLRAQEGVRWVLNNYFGSACGSTECLYELFVTASFYTSLAYIVGWVVSRRIPSR